MRKFNSSFFENVRNSLVIISRYNQLYNFNFDAVDLSILHDATF